MTVLGQSLARPDAHGKVTGATRYPGDLVQPGMLHMKVVFAHRPHARILSLDSSAALAVPGVVTVLTAADVPYNAFGLIEHDQPVLCADKVRFQGDKVALVVAESRVIAEHAAKLVRVEYEDLPVVSDPRVALLSDAALVHEQHGSNLLLHVPIRKGDVQQGFAEADVIIEDAFSTSWQEHAFLQPEAGIAFVDEQNRVVVETAGQWLHEDRKQIAAMLQLPEDQVIIRYAAVGGAFGGREDLSVQHVLALAAWKLKQKVALVWEREESIIGHHKRHPFQIHCRWGANKEGKITAVEAQVYADGGAYASTSAEVLKIATVFSNGCYEVPNIHVDGYAAYTNNVPSGAFRGFGSPQNQFAAEIMVTRLAHALGIDPAEMRRRNMYREGSIESTGNVIPEGVSALACLERCVEELRTRGQGSAVGGQASSPLPLFPSSPLPTHLRRGWGIASGIKNIGYSFGFPEQATASVELYGAEGIERAVLRAGAAEVGQGTHLAMRMIAAETLGLTVEQIELISDDSSEAPNMGSVSASRMTLMGGRAVYEACRAALQQWQDEERPAKATYQYRPPATTRLDPQTGAGRPNYCYGYTSQAVEVEVNTLTGQVQVQQIISVHDVGRAINRQQVEGQIEGCLAQALGYALLEDLKTRDGKILTPFLSSYLLPTSLDMPTKIVPIILEHADPKGPYGARGVGEMALVPLAPAISAAIFDAVGVWVKDLPMTPERVLRAILADSR